LSKILSSLIKNYSAKENVIISLNKEDLRKLEKGLLDTLKEEVRKGITLRPSDDIQAGFIISYDSGKSYYDFTDTALAEYIGLHLKPKLKEILE
jgi:vacuolar-type H+-ATPase subunit E/Vma4